MKEDADLQVELLESRLSKRQISKYYRAMMSDSKMRMLSELREHYELYSFIPFTYFENMKEEQLEEMLQLTLAYANEDISKTDLVTRADVIMEEQKAALNNRNLKKFMSDYLPEAYLPYVGKMTIGFFNTHENHVAARFDMIEPKTYYQIEESIYKELMMLPKEFLSDKHGLNIELYAAKEDNYSLAVFELDPEKYDIACNVPVKDLLYALTFNTKTLSLDEVIESADIYDENAVREQFEQLQDIKKNWIKDKNDDRMIQELDHYLEKLQDRDTIAIRHQIVSIDELNELVLACAKEGAEKIKYMLEGYDPLISSNYVYRDSRGSIRTTEYRDIKNLFTSLEQIDRFQDILTYGHSRAHVQEVTEKEKEDLIAACQKNGWLKRNGYEFQEGLSEEEYDYSFMRCERRLDLMKLLEHVSWAIRDGFLYEDMAFIQQVNGGDEYWTLIKHDGRWIDFESVTFRPCIARGEFYTMLDQLHDEGVQAIEKDLNKTRKRGGINERQL